MKVMVFTSDDTPERDEALDFGAKLEADGYTVAYLAAEDPATPNLQEIYDIVRYPSFVVAQDDGTIVEKWHGIIPLSSDIKMFLG